MPRLRPPRRDERIGGDEVTQGLLGGLYDANARRDSYASHAKAIIGQPPVRPRGGRAGTPGSPPAISVAHFSRRALQVRQHFVRVSFCFYVIEDMLDLAVRAYHESSPRDAFHFLAVHVLLFDHPEQVGNFLLWIGQQGERQTELVLKFLLRGCCVGGYSEQRYARLLDR